MKKGKIPFFMYDEVVEINETKTKIRWAFKEQLDKKSLSSIRK